MEIKFWCINELGTETEVREEENSFACGKVLRFKLGKFSQSFLTFLITLFSPNSLA